MKKKNIFTDIKVEHTITEEDLDACVRKSRDIQVSDEEAGIVNSLTTIDVYLHQALKGKSTVQEKKERMWEKRVHDYRLFVAMEKHYGGSLPTKVWMLLSTSPCGIAKLYALRKRRKYNLPHLVTQE